MSITLIINADFMYDAWPWLVTKSFNGFKIYEVVHDTYISVISISSKAHYDSKINAHAKFSISD